MIRYRPTEPIDQSFIVDAWVSSFRLSNSAGLIQMEDWRSIMFAQVVKALSRPDVETIVAYDPDAADRLADLAGFITFDRTTRPIGVYYVYVKQAYRRGRGHLGPEGIGRGLFRAAGIDPALPFWYACKTPIVGKVTHKIPMARWNPLAARFPKEKER